MCYCVVLGCAFVMPVMCVLFSTVVNIFLFYAIFLLLLCFYEFIQLG